MSAMSHSSANQRRGQSASQQRGAVGVQIEKLQATGSDSSRDNLSGRSTEQVYFQFTASAICICTVCNQHKLMHCTEEQALRNFLALRTDNRSRTKSNICCCFFKTTLPAHDPSNPGARKSQCKACRKHTKLDVERCTSCSVTTCALLVQLVTCGATPNINNFQLLHSGLGCMFGMGSPCWPGWVFRKHEI